MHTALLLSAWALGCWAEPIALDGLKSTPPSSWKEAKPTNAMQYKVFTLPGAEGAKDATLTIFYFGRGGGGGLEENIARWKKMVKTDAEPQREEFTVGQGVKVTLVDLAGTYLHKARPMDPSSPTEERPDHRIIGVFFDSANGPYFMRLVGPAKTIAVHAQGFKDWLRNFK